MSSRSNQKPKNSSWVDMEAFSQDGLVDQHEQVHERTHSLLEHRKTYLSVRSEGTWRALCNQLKLFADHMERHFSFEENDGFLISIARRDPSMAESAHQLREEHDMLRTAVGDLLAVIERERDPVQRERYVTHVLDQLLGKLDAHEHLESSLLRQLAEDDQ